MSTSVKVNGSINSQEVAPEIVDFTESSDSVKACEMSKRVLTRSEATGVKLFLLNSPTSSFGKWVGEVILASGMSLNKTQTKSFCSLAASGYCSARRTMLPAQAKEEVKASFGNFEKEASSFYYL